MIVSLNEVAITAQKATAGCGHPFGIAEEMGFATRWLCARGLRGAEKLIHSLEQFKAVELNLSETADNVAIGGAEGIAIPSLVLAPSVADLLVAHRADKKIITVGTLAHPLMLLPFLARIATDSKRVNVSWSSIDGDSVMVEFNRDGAQIYADNSFSLIQARADNVVCRWGALETTSPVLYTRAALAEQRNAVIASGCTLSDSAWQKLQVFAHNTYVPISEQSRLSGAGAGLTDND